MKILFVDACVRPWSRTRKLAQCVLEKFPDAEVITWDLQKEGLQPFTQDMLSKRNGFIQSGDYSDPMFRWAHTFNEADLIVVAAPYWDLSFPSSVKVLVEHLMVQDLTFFYDADNKPYGVTHIKKLIYVCTAGGEVYDDNMGFTYLRAVFSRFFSIPEYAYFDTENLDMVSPEEIDALLEQTLDEIRNAE